MQFHLKHSLFFVLFCLASLQSKGANMPHEYWVGFMFNGTPYNTVNRLHLAAKFNTTVYIYLPAQGFKDTVFVAADSVLSYNLPLNLTRTVEYDQAVNRGVQIVSDQPIHVTALNLSNVCSDASMVMELNDIPIQPKYLTVHPDTSSRISRNQFLLVAVSDTTRIKFTPVADLFGTTNTKNKPVYVTLHKGQVYQVSTRDNFTGTVIEVLSKHKLVVISGDRINDWPYPGGGDHQCQQLIPNQQLDTIYHVTPFKNHTKGYVLKIVPIAPNARIVHNGNIYNNVSPNNPLILQVNTETESVVHSNTPFNCVQFMRGGNSNGYTIPQVGDPAMVSNVSCKNLINDALVRTVKINFLRYNFSNIIVPTHARASVLLNNTPLDSNLFKAFSHDKRYSYAMIEHTDGLHQLHCDKGFLVYTYNVGPFESFLYFNGVKMMLNPLDFKDSSIQYLCSKQSVRVQFTAIDSQNFKSFKWNFPDGDSSTGALVYHDFKDSGKYEITLYGTDSSNRVDSITKSIHVDWKWFTDSSIYPKSNFDHSPNDSILCLSQAIWTFNSNTYHKDSIALRWEIDNQFQSQDSFINNYKFNSLGKHKITLIASTKNACVDSISQYIHVSKGANAQFHTEDSIQCFSNHQFIIQTQNKDTGLSNSWFLNSQPFTFDNNKDTIRLTNAGWHRLKLIQKENSSQCNDTFEYLLRLIEEPIALFSINSDTQCLKYNSFEFTNASTSNLGIFQSKWYLNQQLIDSNINFSHSMNDTGNFKIQLFVSDSFACKDSIEKSVTVIGNPKTNILIKDSIQCFGNYVFEFTSNAEKPLTWLLDQQVLNNRMEDSLMLRNPSVGPHQIHLINRNAYCADTGQSAFKVLQNPIAKLTINQDTQCFNFHSFDIQNSTETFGDDLLESVLNIDNNNLSNFDFINNKTFSDTGTYQLKLFVKTKAFCVDSLYKSVYIKPNPDGQLIGDSVCLNKELKFKWIQTYGPLVNNWRWTLSDGRTSTDKDPLFRGNPAGDFDIQLNVAAINQCQSDFTLLKGAKVYDLPDPQFNVNSEELGKLIEVEFKALPDPNNTYQWTFPDGSIGDLDKIKKQYYSGIKGTVKLVVRNQFQCIDSSEQWIVLYIDSFNLFVPNAISLNGDLLNDRFGVDLPMDVEAFKMSVYSRWGECLYNSEVASDSWDGRYQGQLVPQAVYVYVIEFKYKNKNYLFRGTLNVLR